jgi:hypothetical protein
MKQIKFLSILAFSLMLASCNGQTKSKTSTTTQSTSKIEVIDFHSTHRCMTCKAIEANTKFTLDTYFSKDVKDGNITFQVINVDEKENEKLAEKFEASGTSLFLNVVKDGKEKHIDLTEFAFLEGNDQDAFSKQLKVKIENELKSL